MQQSRDKYFPQFENQGINPVGDNAQVTEYPHKQTTTCTQCDKGLLIPSRFTCKSEIWQRQINDKVNIFAILVYRSESKRLQEQKIGNLYDGKQTRGPQDSLVASIKIANSTVGEQITVEQLIEERIIMTISKAMIMNIGITSVSSRPKRFCIYYYYSTHRQLSSMHLQY